MHVTRLSTTFTFNAVKRRNKKLKMLLTEMTQR